jgi:hypothetical protein
MSEARVDIMDAVKRVIVDHCDGPMWAGGCPRADRGAIVPCHGRRLVPLGEGPDLTSALPGARVRRQRTTLALRGNHVIIDA